MDFVRSRQGVTGGQAPEVTWQWSYYAPECIREYYIQIDTTKIERCWFSRRRVTLTIAILNFRWPKKERERSCNWQETSDNQGIFFMGPMVICANFGLFCVIVLFPESAENDVIWVCIVFDVFHCWNFRDSSEYRIPCEKWKWRNRGRLKSCFAMNKPNDATSKSLLMVGKEGSNPSPSILFKCQNTRFTSGAGLHVSYRY